MDTTTQALHFLALGMNTIPLKTQDKAPIENLKWKRFNYFKQNPGDVRFMFNEHEGNIGIICGEVSNNLVVFDCDTEEVFEKTKEELEPYNPKIVKTSRGGHIYIITHLPAKSKSILTPLGKIDVRSNGLYVVAENSQHPDGTRYQIVNDPDFLPLFKIGKITELIELESDLHETSALQIIRENGLLEKLATGYYDSRSEADMALITFLIRKGYNKEQIAYFIVKAGYDSRYLDILGKNPNRASAWLDLSIQKAEKLPSTQEYDETVEKMNQLKELLVKTPFGGKVGSSLYKVLLAHINTCAHAHKWEYHFSVREASEKAGISHVTFMKRNNELIEQGFVGVVARNRGIEGNVYNLQIEKLESYLKENSVQDFNSQSPISVTNCESYGQLGLFERGAFGHSSAQIYNALASNDSLSVNELMTLTGRSRNTVKRALSLLVDGNLVKKLDSSYSILTVNLAEYAKEEGFIDKAVKRKQTHIRERLSYRYGWK